MTSKFNWNLYPHKLLDELKKHQRKVAQSVKKDKMPKFIFLCGKDITINNGANRKTVKDFYEKVRPDIICVYSEELCKIFDINIIDLLSFEEILAEFSDGIILFIESDGTVCEIGAFAMKENLINKLLVFNDIQHEGKSTFINDGPIKKIQNRNKDNVIYTDLNAIFSNKHSYNRLCDFVPRNKKCKINRDESNVQLNAFLIELLELIFLLGPIKSKDLIFIYKYIKDFKSFNYFSESNNKTIKKVKINQIIKLLSKLNIIEEDLGYLSVINKSFEFRNVMFNMNSFQFNNIRSEFLCRKYRYKERIIA